MTNNPKKKGTQLAVSMVADDPTYRKTKEGKFEEYKPHPKKKKEIA